MPASHRSSLRIILSLLIGACTNQTASKPTEVVTHASPSDDDNYHQAFQKASRNVEVFTNFETKFLIHVTYFAPAFRSAFYERFKDLYGSSEPLLDEATKKAGFFVSIFSPNTDKIDLNDQTLWTIFLQQHHQQAQDNKLPPVHVKHLPRKEQWKPFFPYINKWTKEFFVLFEAPSIEPHASALVQQTEVQLTFSNADARVTMTW